MATEIIEQTEGGRINQELRLSDERRELVDALNNIASVAEEQERLFGDDPEADGTPVWDAIHDALEVIARQRAGV